MDTLKIIEQEYDNDPFLKVMLDVAVGKMQCSGSLLKHIIAESFLIEKRAEELVTSKPQKRRGRKKKEDNSGLPLTKDGKPNED